MPRDGEEGEKERARERERERERERAARAGGIRFYYHQSSFAAVYVATRQANFPGNSLFGDERGTEREARLYARIMG